MARSFRQTDICGLTTAQSEKWDKKTYNRMLRRKISFIVKDNPEVIFPEKKDVSDSWKFSKDGKMWFGDLKDKAPEIYKKEMRK